MYLIILCLHKNMGKTFKFLILLKIISDQLFLKFNKY